MKRAGILRKRGNRLFWVCPVAIPIVVFQEKEAKVVFTYEETQSGEEQDALQKEMKEKEEMMNQKDWKSTILNRGD